MRLAQKVRYPNPLDHQFEIAEEIVIPFNTSIMEFRERYASQGYREAAANCQCIQAEIIARRSARLGRAELPDDVDNFTLADFKIYPAAYEFARMMIAGEPLIDSEGIERPGLLFSGPYGGGKSVLSGIIYNARQSVLQEAIWLKFVTLLKRLQETYNRDYAGPSLAELIDQLCICPLLVVDEFGNRNEALNGLQISRDRNENMLRIIDYRTAKKKPTIFTTNLDPDLLYSHADPAIASRIQGLCHIVVMDNGIDFRSREATR